MDYAQTHRLFARGVVRWNRWANKMLKIKETYQKNGMWEVKEAKWKEKAKAPFSTPQIQHRNPFGHCSFSCFIFPGDAVFDHVTFNREVFFEGTTFKGEVWFDTVTFEDDAHYGGTVFEKMAIFRNSKFNGNAFFNDTTFMHFVSFVGTAFNKNAIFVDAKFMSQVNFFRATFHKKTTFSHVNFEKIAQFDEARFKAGANFYAIQTKSSFSLDEAVFETEAPDFIQAHFLEAPRLDNIVMPALDVMKQQAKAAKAKAEKSAPEPQDSEIDQIIPINHRQQKQLEHAHTTATEMAKWRALRRMAEMGHDHERKLDFFAREIISARYHPSTTRLEKVIGHLYEFFSDFGRSFTRPLIGLGATIIISFCSFIVISLTHAVPNPHPAVQSFNDLTKPVLKYIGYAPVEPKFLACRKGMSKPTEDVKGPRDPYTTGLSPEVASRTFIGWEAFSLALRNAFVIGDWGSEVAHRTYGCLYGLERFGDTLAPIVPPWVSFISAVQKLWSAVMLFLLGLAFRNLLKMH
jgi:hypothetical protein